MNDVVVVSGVCAAIACCVLFVFYYVLSGVHGSLASSNVGEVYNFEYQQPLTGEYKRFLAKVIAPVVMMTDNDVNRLNAKSRYRRYDPNFARGKCLVTCQMVDGTIRNFYAERTRNVRKLPVTNKLLYKVASFMI
jgi:hypothetical protein